ncbi:discoidin domain-containing protein [Solicola gregarius]|uniref:Discoidin domain-containing protein n=1 Tax=Solicola gregarius TaxID=2908642 RepID=A0AA46YJD0_9ACTN|nr:discoidin domain-containing protein [Solicola gregarius]UYM03419.1 discoidin domain-containing protein [Solicola gregarius]
MRSRRTFAALAVVVTLAVMAALTGGTASAGAKDKWWVPDDRPTPDSRINVSGEPFRGTDKNGDVRGFIDAHNHVMSNEGFGGRLVCGKPFDEGGVEEALKDCPEHYPNGIGAWFENITGGSNGTHDPVGWPTFEDWPSYKSLTHQQNYYAWIERAWRSGQRVMVNNLVSNGVICSLLPRDRGCNEMDAIRLEARKSWEMQAYIDDMYGGPGKGWFRIVTNPAQARKVIEDGKLAVVLGVETSEPFGCKQILGVAQCSKDDIDKGLDEVHDLGVRSMFLCHKFDNALCGVRFDQGVIGTVIDIGQFLSTGTFWQTEQCTGPQHDNPIGLVSLPKLEAKLPIGVKLPTYDPDARCNTRGLTRLGEYALHEMMKRNMMVEIDHMGVTAADRTFDVLEAEDYPGVISSHSWMDANWTKRLYRLGGFKAEYPGQPENFAKQAANGRHIREKFHVGLGLGLDMNGLGGWPAPEGKDGKYAVHYPYRSLDGTDRINRQVTGERTWDVNLDGMAHYGLLPDWLEQVRKASGGKATDDLMHGAESYLETWGATVSHRLARNLAVDKAATASSSEWNPITNYGPAQAFDGDAHTRWASDWNDDQWLQTDLGNTRRIGRVTLDWQRAYGLSYRIQVSTDGTKWRTVRTTYNADGGIDTARFASTKARYVRIRGIDRATKWGYSLYEVGVYRR